MKSTWFSGIGFVALTGGFLFAYSGFGITAAAATSTAAVQSTYGRLPLSFEANHGQWDPAVQFVTRGPGHQLFLTPSDAVLALRTEGAKAEARAGDIHQRQPFSSPASASHSVVRMRFDGANPQAEIVGLDKLPGIVNYILGDDPSKWRTNIPTYQKVEYRDVYPGIDLVYYGNQGQLEYDLVVAPGADLKQITLAFEGVETINVDGQGDLVLTVPTSVDAPLGDAATLHMHKPVVYQRDAHGNKQLLVGSYLLLTAKLSSDLSVSASSHPSEMTHVAFQVTSYDESQPLIIDPVLSWATYLGGSDQDEGWGITVDQAGNAYVTGRTGSSGFPGTPDSPIQSTLGSSPNAFVTKINAAGTALVYSTYLGDSNGTIGSGIAVDKNGHAYVTGRACGHGFPVTPGSLQSTFAGGGCDVFVTKLNTTGSGLIYSTYLGGSGYDHGSGIAVDQSGSAYITGRTGWPGTSFPDPGIFPGTESSMIQSTFGGEESDAFVAKLNDAGTALIYSTYLGGSSTDVGNAIAIDQVGAAYVTGYTCTPGSGFPATASSAIQSIAGGGCDAFVTKINSSGTTLVYSTYLGGTESEQGEGIAVDLGGNAYVTGGTTTPGSGFPGTATSLIQSTNGGRYDAFVAKLNATGTALAYSTYLGGSGSDEGRGITVDQAGNVYVTGLAGSSGFPGTAGSPIQSALAGAGPDAFVAKINAAGTALVYSTYLGDGGPDIGLGIALDTAGNAYVIGNTSEPRIGFPGTATNPIQSTFAGGSADVFVAKISSNLPFVAFKAKAEIDVRRRGDRFQVRTAFTLDPSNNGINPLTEAVTVQVGNFFATIPAGSFKLKKGRYIFEGIINGVKLEAVLRSLILGHDYEFTMEGKGADFTGLENPVTVSLTIGDDSGKATIDAQFE